MCSSFCSSIGMLESNPGKSCVDIYQINKATRGMSHDYWVNTTTGTHQVYCDMELKCGGHKGGWMRIAHYDISRGDSAGCYLTTFSVQNVGFNKICGKIKGYQKGSPDVFHGSSLDNGYVHGVSITIGNPRKHLWTYANGVSHRCEKVLQSGGGHKFITLICMINNKNILCTSLKSGGAAPPGNTPMASVLILIMLEATVLVLGTQEELFLQFVGEHYCCESGNTGQFQ